MKNRNSQNNRFSERCVGKLWSEQRGYVFDHHKKSIRGISFCESDPDSLATCSDDGEIFYYKSTMINRKGNSKGSGSSDLKVEKRGKIIGHKGSVSAMEFIRSEKGKIISAGMDKTIKVWSLEKDRLLKKSVTKDYTLLLKTHPKGNTYFRATFDEEFVFYDSKKSSEIKKLNLSKYQLEVVSAEWNALNDKELIFSTNGGEVVYLDVSSLKIVKRLKGNVSSVYSFAQNPSSKMLYATGQDSTVAFWDVKNDICIRSVSCSNSSVRVVSMECNRNFVGFSTKDKKLNNCIYFVGLNNNGKPRKVVQEMRLNQPVAFLQFNPSRNCFAYEQGSKLCMKSYKLN